MYTEDSIQQIAAAFGNSQWTIRNNIRDIRNKVGVHGRAELIRVVLLADDTAGRARLRQG